MALLVLVSCLWALSFGLIKFHLSGVDPALVAAVRLVLALLVFAPFWRPTRLTKSSLLRWSAVGAVQFGFMYVAYLRAFVHLAAHEVALLTIFTPLLVWLLEDLRSGRFSPRTLVAASLAVVGAAAVFARTDASPSTLVGIMWVQASNFCFALGQVAYRTWRTEEANVGDRELFATLYAGALLATLPIALPKAAQLVELSAIQWSVLLFLGIVSSGLGFFFWNVGATRVNAAVLAALNNAKVPLGLAASILIFGERGDPVRLAAGLGLILAALAIAGRA